MHAVDLVVPEDHPAFAGHFPGQPLLPGVTLLAEVLEALLDAPDLCARVGPTPRIAAAKFLAPVRPGAALRLELEATSNGVRFEARQGDRTMLTGHFEAAR